MATPAAEAHSRARLRIEDREYQLNVRALAAPVISRTGEAAAAIAVVARLDRLPAEKYRDIADALIRAARAVSRASEEIARASAAHPDPVIAP